MVRIDDFNPPTPQIQRPSQAQTGPGNLAFSALMLAALKEGNAKLAGQLGEIIMLNSALRLGELPGETPEPAQSGALPSLEQILQPWLRSQAPTVGKMTALPQPTPDPQAHDRRNFDALIDQAAARHSLDPNLVRAVVTAESDYNPRCVSKAGAMGLMQLMPDTARDLGVSDPFDPVQNIEAGTRYLAQMLDRFKGKLSQALAAYNWGPSNVEAGGNWPSETRNYVRRVTRLQQVYSSGLQHRA